MLQNYMQNKWADTYMMQVLMEILHTDKILSKIKRERSISFLTSSID